jgi:hypothetical protein
MLSTVTSRAPVHWMSVRHLKLRRSAVPKRIPLPLCSICDKPVQLENSNTDEDGQAIHEECYILKLTQNRTTKPAQSTLNT